MPKRKAAPPHKDGTVMKVIYPIITPTLVVDLPELPTEPGYDELKKLIEPHLDGEKLEHVSVFWDDQRLDMFVGEMSSINGRAIRNIRATEIYRNNVLRHDKTRHPESMPAICGPVVLFDRRVWF